jgi:hypothetical protein
MRRTSLARFAFVIAKRPLIIVTRRCAAAFLS